MNSKTNLLVLIAAILGAASVHANAALVIEQAPDANPAPKVSPASAPPAASKASVIDPKTRKRIELDAFITSRIQQEGTPPDEIPVQRWLGKPMTLMDALKIVLPGGWRAYSDGDFDLGSTLNAQVTWSGSLTWVMALNAVITSVDLRAKIDWNQREVTLSAAPKAAQAAPALASVPAATFAVAAPVLAPVPAPALAPEKRWMLTADRTLLQNIRVLVEAEGWNLVWEADDVDYLIDVPLQFTGELIGNGGVVDRLIEAYREEGDAPLAVQWLNTSKTVRVYRHVVGTGTAARRLPAGAVAPAPVKTR
jgi:hypothetical protein